MAPAELVVGESAGPALGVVDHGDLEQWAVGKGALGDLGDEGDVVGDLRRDPAADVADDDRVAEPEAEDVHGVDPRVEAGDDEEAQVGEDDGALVTASRGEGTVTGQCLLHAAPFARVGRFWLGAHNESMMQAGSVEQRALAAACAVAAERGVPCGQAAVINAGSNVLVHLAPAPVVARVMSGTVVLHGDPECWLSREVAVLDYLAPTGIAVAPSPLIGSGPYRHDGLWMIFCELVEHRGQADLSDGAEMLGRTLRKLHDELSAFPGDLPSFTDLHDRIERLLRLLRPSRDLSAERIEALEARLLALGEPVFAAPLPAQALHGDTSLFNLLRRTSGGLVWNDFEDVLRGPVHWDVAGFLISLELRGADPDFVATALDAYGGVDQRELAPFAAAHDVYDEIWQLYDVQRRS